MQLTDRTIETAMIAVQGPAALRCVEPLVGADLGGLGYYTGTETTICGHAGIVSRTGYTGEDGCELIVPAAAAVEVWEKSAGPRQRRGCDGRPASAPATRCDWKRRCRCMATS